MQTYVMKKGETLFPECYNKQKTAHGQREDNNENTKKHQQYKTDNTQAQNNTQIVLEYQTKSLYCVESGLALERTSIKRERRVLKTFL
jgi:hypothetical protein